MSDLVCAEHHLPVDLRRSCDLCGALLCSECLVGTVASERLTIVPCPGCRDGALGALGVTIAVIPVWAFRSAGPGFPVDSPRRNFTEKVFLSEEAARAALPPYRDLVPGVAVARVGCGKMKWMPRLGGSLYPSPGPKPVDVAFGERGQQAMAAAVQTLQARLFFESSVCTTLLDKARPWVLSAPDQQPVLHGGWFDFKAEHGGLNPILQEEQVPGSAQDATQIMRFVCACTPQQRQLWEKGLPLLTQGDKQDLALARKRHAQLPPWPWDRVALMKYIQSCFN